MDDFRMYEFNRYSQSGEDGVIKEILQRVSKKCALDRWCVEFGAWDGVHLSNTCRLIKEESYSAVLIEADRKRARKLDENFPQSNVIKINSFVEFEGRNSLDRILSLTPIAVDFDLLSIDIDGADYWIFESMNLYRPKVVCIEFNSFIPNQVEFVQPKSFQIKQGSSALAISRLGQSKGYSLVHATRGNLLLVRSDLREYVTNRLAKVDEINRFGGDPTFVFVGFDGSLLSNKSEIDLRWHEFTASLADMQPLPKFLRKFPQDYGPLRKSCFIAWMLWCNSDQLLSILKRRVVRKHKI